MNAGALLDGFVAAPDQNRMGLSPSCTKSNDYMHPENTFSLSPDKGERVTSLVLSWLGPSGYLLGFTLTTLDGQGKTRRWCSSGIACASNTNVKPRTNPIQVCPTADMGCLFSVVLPPPSALSPPRPSINATNECIINDMVCPLESPVI